VGKVFKALNKAEADSDFLNETSVSEEEIPGPPASEPSPSSPVTVQPASPKKAETFRKKVTKKTVTSPRAKAPSPSAPTKPKKPASVQARETIKPDIQESGHWDERLVKATKISGAVAESIRTLRTRLLHPFRGDIPRKVLVTSATPGEGKSFICANLGISLAQGVDHYSLIVDCDLRKPAQHRLFGLSNERGLVDYLREGTDLSDLIIRSGVNKLSIIPAGPPPVNPAELLSSGAMITLVDELVHRYDDRIILLDSPPLQAASETAVLAQNVDGVILVVRWNASRREHVKALVDLIGRERIIGVVFNAYKATVLDSKVFGYYEYQQNYYYGEK